MDVVYVDDMLKAPLTMPFKTRHLVEIGNDHDTYALVDLDTKDVTIGGAPDFELVENGQVYIPWTACKSS